MVWKYPDYYVVGREHVRAYANAVQNLDAAYHHEEAAADLGYDSLVAPLTYVSAFALLIQRHFFMHVDVGMETMQIVQVDQKFVYHRPIQVGDKLWGTMHVHSVEERFGADIVVTRNVCETEDGEIVLEAFTTMMGQEGEGSAHIKWDSTTGQVVRTAVD